MDYCRIISNIKSIISMYWSIYWRFSSIGFECFGMNFKICIVNIELDITVICKVPKVSTKGERWDRPLTHDVAK